MIECPNCSHPNVTGSAFCVEYGVNLLLSKPLTNQKVDLGPQIGSEPRRSPLATPVGSRDNWVTLHLLESGQVLPLTERNEFTMGRVSEGQSVMPDIDLTPYQAFAHGVSRLHAVIRRGVDAIFLLDLDSGNGTFINGKRLEPKEERALSNGDVVALGGLKIQVLLKTNLKE